LVHDLGLTIIIAEHRLERVIQFVDRILLINGSADVQLGFTRDILAKSHIAPPLVELAKVAGMKEIPLTVREFRRSDLEVPPMRRSAPKISNETVIEVESLTCAYSDGESEYALRNISLQIKSGEIIALMGRNGAGKSTLLRSLVGLSPITSGQVRVLGGDPSRFNSRELISSVGYVPQEPGDLLIESTVQEECKRADLDNGCDEGKTLSIFTSLVGDVPVSIHPRDLSEGQKLTLALSILLSAHPQVIVLDEPTRGLDYEAKRKLVRILKEIASNDRTVLLATHDVELVAELSDRVLFIADGELISDGPVAEALTASPAFAPQVAKALPNRGLLTVSDVKSVLE
jgi:energy-coupling factor transport system ATP-binding protein